MLDEIIEAKRKRIAAQKQKLPLEVIKERAALKKTTRNFREALLGKNLSLIAEIKKASPSRGDIAPDINVGEIAKTYEDSDASAISVLTEEDFFKGQPEYIEIVKENSSLPVLRKDFVLEEYQVYESRYLGADALLLISAILDENELRKLAKLTHKLNMEPFIEVHSEEELKTALGAEAKVIGINNRNLKTFETDLKTTERLIKLVGKDRIVVSESGIKTGKDAAWLKSLGVDAILVGESIVSAPDIKKMIESFKS
ncbi:MAG: indole-3-glycerol phosphate synthase TrpC [Actinobacteria bacterium]|nr:MAG: indole-3-glycerol phosphate synthase TrpC [Actinomycetota bacterium]